ncbi:MAG: photosynthetic complex assembly protein PuhC [Dokdonella sp.]|uniref:photosynthetic complex assembly protein PuhC n=1 Tax=Dokdonella sp. TaxID=2291710 RepID=UPI003264468D
MSEHGHNAQFPKLPLYTAAALIVTTLILVTITRLTGFGDLRTPQTAIVSERDLRFQDMQDGGITVIDASTQQVVEQVAPGTNGFLRGTLRGLARERKREGIGPDIAFRLTGRSDGRLLLEDPATRRLIDLGSFGPTNAAVFARLLLEQPKGTAPVTATAPAMPGTPLASLGADAAGVAGQP